MKSTERRLKIFEIVKKSKFVDVNQLAEMFQVSSMTIRRDLAKLENQGVLTTSYGGATLNEGVSSEPSFGLKSGYSQEYKEQIAYEASLLVNDGDCIFIDCGTTTLELAKLIVNKEITVITNSWKVLSAIHDFSKVKVILAPGEYDPISEGALSSTTIHFLKNYLVDKAFISTQGVDIGFLVYQFLMIMMHKSKKLLWILLNIKYYWLIIQSLAILIWQHMENCLILISFLQMLILIRICLIKCGIRNIMWLYVKV